MYRVWDVFPVAIGLDKTTSRTVTWRSFNERNSDDIFPISISYKKNKTNEGLNKIVLAHGYWSTKYYLPMMKPSEHRGGKRTEHKVLMVSPKFDIKSSSPFSRHSLRPEHYVQDINKIRSNVWNLGLGKFEFRRDEEVKYLWFPAREQYCSSEMFDSWKIKTPGAVFSPSRTWLHREEHVFCTFKNLMRIGEERVGSNAGWDDISSITGAVNGSVKNRKALLPQTDIFQASVSDSESGIMRGLKKVTRLQNFPKTDGDGTN